MISDGAEILSHSVNHVDFKPLSETGTKQEICESKKDLEKRFPVNIAKFRISSWAYELFQ